MTWKSVAICVACWNEEEPNRPTNPNIDYIEGPDEVCYRCGEDTNSGIYVRRDVKS